MTYGITRFISDTSPYLLLDFKIGKNREKVHAKSHYPFSYSQLIFFQFRKIGKRSKNTSDVSPYLYFLLNYENGKKENKVVAKATEILK